MVMLEPTTRPAPRPPLDVRHPSAFVVSTEHPAALRPLTAAIEAHGVFVEVVEPGPWLLDDGHVLLLRAAAAREGAGPTLHELLPLEIRGDDVINRPAALQVAGHATLTASALAEAGVPVLRGRGCSDADDAVDAAFVFGFPVAVRALPPLAGGAVPCRDADTLWEHVDALARMQVPGGNRGLISPLVGR